MRVSTVLKFCSGALAIALTAAAAPESADFATAQQLALGPQKDVIVVLRDQLASSPPMRRAMNLRESAIASSHRSMINELQQARARNVHSFSTINAFATKVTADEASRLANRAEVLAVVPDRVMHVKRVARETSSVSSIPASIALSTAAATSNPLCNTLEPEALQITHTAFLDPKIPQAQSVIDGNGQPVTGKGVKVAWIADGLDPTVAGFTRPDGSKVFIDYQDFTGDGAAEATAGGEAFGDASSIAAQDNPNGVPLLFDISKFVTPAHKLPAGCNIRIRGMAPGASLVGLKVFSNAGLTTTSNFIQAIEWAVVHDDVDVINESFGGNIYPDLDVDPVSLADEAAVKAGVTVVVSTGDAGTAGTIGQPATDSAVIAVGASTQWRFYAQTGDGALPLTPHGGYVNNNISAFSSAGFAQNRARTVDVVAPGDLSWALCSTNIDMFNDCSDFNGNPTGFQSFGGTSESAPLTAGEAALVIQAYRSTHHGADPTPAVVKQIIMSTATDLGAPAQEQGAGLINSLAAVNQALSIDDSHGAPKNRGSQLISSPNSALITDNPNTLERRSFTIGNPGTTSLDLSPTLETLGPAIAGANLSLTLDPSKAATFINSGGARRAYIKRTFTVPAGVQHLDAAIAFQIDLSSSDSPLVLFALLDPQGRQAAYSIPQGSGNGYGHVDVVNPVGGTWTAVVWTRPTGVAGSYSGPIQFNWSAENYVKLGTVSPSRVLLAPGQRTTITAQFQLPSQPGDVAAAIRFENSASASSVSLPAIPFSLRSLIPISSTGGTFTGSLTGGNARQGAGPTQTFEFNVPSGVQNLSLSLQTADSGYVLEGILIDPHGMPLSVSPSLDPAGNLQFGLQMFKNNPEAGRWHFVLLLNVFSSGNQTSLPFTARIGFNGARFATDGLPNSASVKLSASKTTQATVEILNTGSTTNAFFVDARLDSTTRLSLPAIQNPACATHLTLPGACSQYELPPLTTGVQFSVKSTVPVTIDAVNNVGFLVGNTFSPEIYGKKTGPTSAAVTLLEPQIPWGQWDVVPSEIGPYGDAGAPVAPFTSTALVTTQKFDSAVSSDTGDIWADYALGTDTFKGGLLLGSGEAGVISLNIQPSASDVGKTIHGSIYILTFNGGVGTGDEVVRIPYSYTVVK